MAQESICADLLALAFLSALGLFAVMAPRRAASGPSSTLGDRLQELGDRVGNVEKWLMDLHPDHCERVVAKMLQLEGNTRKLYQGYLQQAQADAMASESRLDQLDRQVQDRLLALSDRLSKEADKHASSASALRTGMRDLEQSVSDRIGTLISGVENRFANEEGSALDVITFHADECVDRLHTTAASLLSNGPRAKDGGGVGVSSRSGDGVPEDGAVGESRGRDRDYKRLGFRLRQGAVIRAASRGSSRDSLASHISDAQSVARLRSPRD